jgi:acetolactate synthase-1/3 small subunit
VTAADSMTANEATSAIDSADLLDPVSAIDTGTAPVTSIRTTGPHPLHRTVALVPPSGPKTHTLGVLVENTSGVLARVSSLFSRRGFNITSLTVGETEDPAVSRMTIVVSVEDAPLEQVVKQLHKLINVLKIVEIDPADSVERGLLLVKIATDATTRADVQATLAMFRATVVDVAADTLTVEATGDAAKLSAMLSALRPYGIRELVESGTVAISRGSRSLTERATRAAS